MVGNIKPKILSIILNRTVNPADFFASYDAEDVKDTYPDEYRLYERLGIKSVLAIPLEPRQIALIAVRNPQRYTHQTSMLKLLAYVLLAAYNDKRMADSLSMAFSPENIKSSHDVFMLTCTTVQILKRRR